MQTFIEQAIEENKNNFTQEEYELILNNINLAKKLYLLGFENGREIYK